MKLSKNKLIKLKFNSLLDKLEEKQNICYILNSEIYSYDSSFNVYFKDFSINDNKISPTNFLKLIKSNRKSIAIINQNNLFDNILLDLPAQKNKKIIDLFIENEYAYIFVQEVKEKFIEINLIKTDIYKLLKDKSFNNYTLNSIYTESSKNYLKLDNTKKYFKNTFINNVDENTFTLTILEPNKLLNNELLYIDYEKTKIIYINKRFIYS